ncbi:MAG: hypothetical protein LUC41_01015 [Clostridiales bacterium]|nr:hypothetical protein [Clostridiales bacterium]
MKKAKRIIALVGVIALVALYVSTLVLAIIGSEQTMSLFIAAVVSTVILPVLIWAYSFIYQLIKKNYSNEAVEKNLQLLNQQKDDAEK